MKCGPIRATLPPPAASGSVPSSFLRRTIDWRAASSASCRCSGVSMASAPRLKYGCAPLSSSKSPSFIWMLVSRAKLASTSASVRTPAATAAGMPGA